MGAEAEESGQTVPPAKAVNWGANARNATDAAIGLLVPGEGKKTVFVLRQSSLGGPRSFIESNASPGPESATCTTSPNCTKRTLSAPLPNPAP